MSLQLSSSLLAEIEANGEVAYPDEGAGFLLGALDGENRIGLLILPANNKREDQARQNRYLIAPEEMLNAEQLAASRELEVIGVFHSHPDHPNKPSEFDREWALPWFSYLISTVNNGKAGGTRSWRLSDDRSKYSEEKIVVVQSSKEK